MPDPISGPAYIAGTGSKLADWLLWQFGQTGIPGKAGAALNYRHVGLDSFDPLSVFNSSGPPPADTGFPLPVPVDILGSMWSDPNAPANFRAVDQANHRNLPDSAYSSYDNWRQAEIDYAKANNGPFDNPTTHTQISQSLLGQDLPGQNPMGSSLAEVLNLPGVPFGQRPGSWVANFLTGLGMLNENPYGSLARNTFPLLFGNSGGTYTPPTNINPALAPQIAAPVAQPTPASGSGGYYQPGYTGTSNRPSYFTDTQGNPVGRR